MSRCVRCGWPEQAHAHREQAANGTVQTICHRYDRPAPWWMRVLAWRP